MSEFTAEFIAKTRKTLSHEFYSPVSTIAYEALDEIERLQARVQELEQERSDKVYCTANREYPKQGQLVFYQVVLKSKEYRNRITSMDIGFLLFANDNKYCRAKGRGLCPDTYTFYDFEKIYWKPFEDLKAQYERGEG